LKPPAAKDLPRELAKLPKYHAVSLRDDPDFDRDVERIIAAIEFHLRDAAAKAGGVAAT
jgi:hypothetical protein